ncbi:MAG TPA: Asp-tRNA(Asn)/Glu-tRNA(Gln) amidotransferase subunit GatC [Pyrodictium sp.]|nr:Asp-tRNA(Asn)/Glu-tRNA(Gln) amidotransferase subunit GatC [Pyrodictium sp.]
MSVVAMEPKELLNHLMWLARLELTDDEKRRVAVDLENIVEFINKLFEVEVKDIEPLYHPLDKEGLLREDIPKEQLRQEEVLMNAAASEKGYIKAPRTIEE